MLAGATQSRVAAAVPSESYMQSLKNTRAQLLRNLKCSLLTDRTKELPKTDSKLVCFTLLVVLSQLLGKGGHGREIALETRINLPRD